MLSGIDADMQEQRNTAPANMQQEEEQVQTVFLIVLRCTRSRRIPASANQTTNALILDKPQRGSKSWFSSQGLGKGDLIAI